MDHGLSTPIDPWPNRATNLVPCIVVVSYMFVFDATLH